MTNENILIEDILCLNPCANMGSHVAYLIVAL